MSEADLEEIRRARLQQLREQSTSQGGSGEGGASNQDEARQRETDARTSILSQILLPPAADRLGRIRLVNAARATDVENRLISLARSGQLRQKITEEQLREILEGISEKTAERERIVVRRTKGWGREEDDLDDLLDL